MSILCRLGLHRNRDIYRGEWNGFSQSVVWRCTRCDKQESVELISPLSGPRKGPMHPAFGAAPAFAALDADYKFGVFSSGGKSK